jgi:hypothetical protein
MKSIERSDLSALLTSALSLAAAFGLPLSPDALTVLSSCAPILDRSINRVLGLFEKKSFARMESVRLGICYSEIAATVKRNREKGLDAIMHDPHDGKDGYSKTEEVIEAVFKAAINDAQTVKAKVYGTLIGNLAFQSRYDDTQAYLLLKTAEQLSYYELCLIAVLNKYQAKDYSRIEHRAYECEDSNIAELFMAMVHLQNLGLFKRVRPFSLGLIIYNLELSFVGRDLCRLLELETLEKADQDTIENLLINHICEVRPL